jgi:transcriptional regulator with XRE-family HTH domain
MERTSPEAARVAAKIRDVMSDRGVTSAELAARVERLTGRRPSDMWVSRIKNGKVHLTVPRRVAEWGPNQTLELVAEALDMDADELAAAANDNESHTAATA